MATGIDTTTHMILGRIHSHLQQGCITQHQTYILSHFAPSMGSFTKKTGNINDTIEDQKNLELDGMIIK